MVSGGIVLTVTVVTLACLAAIGIGYSRGRIGSVDDYTTARGTTGTGVTAATVLASSMGAWILFSPAEAGAAFGGLSAVAGYAVGSASAALVYVFLGPRIRRLVPEGRTITEYALVRYGRVMYVYVLVVSVLYMFMALAANMTGIVGVLSLVAGIPPWQTAALVGGFVLLYTAYGGLKASIVTDTVQLIVILPALGLVFVATLLALGGPSEAGATVVATDPSLLDPGFLPGVLFGVYVVIAIVGAELLNQAWWQRVYAAQDVRTVRRSYALAGVLTVPVVLVAGLFGVLAAGHGLVSEPGDASVALFALALEVLPDWLLVVFVVLALVLVTSSVDTLFNAIASVVAADLPRAVGLSDRSLRTVGRLATVVVALGATLIGAQSYSVLELFLTADLFAVATAVPLLAGLYTGRIGGRGVLVAALAGLAVGVAFMPTLSPVLALVVPAGLLPEPSFLHAFVGAAVVSTATTLAVRALGSARFDLGRLSAEIVATDERIADD